jgi:hypothetical protein
MAKSRAAGDEGDFFWQLADEALERDDVDEGTLMGFPCLRVSGDFFATCEHRSGDLIVKLPRERVEQLIDEGVGAPFAPAGRVFKEWTLVAERDRATWLSLINEAHAFVKGA